MYLRWLFYFYAVASLIIGLGFLLVPDLAATAYGGKLDPTATTLARFLGTAALPLAWVSWVAARTVGSKLKLALVRPLGLTELIRFVLTYVAVSAGVTSATGAITNYVLSAIVTIAFGYYGWVNTAAATT